MKQNTNQEKQTPPAPKGGMSHFRIALMLTAIPIIVLSAIGAGGIISNPASVAWGVVFSVAGWLWGLAILVCIGFAIAGKRKIALGILVGIGTGMFVGLGATCFAAFAAIA